MKRRSALALGIGLALAAACGGGDNGAGVDGGTPPGADAGGDDGTVLPGADGSTPTGDAPQGDAWGPLPPAPATPALWYWHHAYLSATNAAEPANSEKLIDEAVAAGYTGMSLWDSSTTFMDLPNWDTSKLQAVTAYAAQKGLGVMAITAPYGYSNDALQYNPNWAEANLVSGGQFTVASGAGGLVLQPVNTLPPIQDGGFEGDNSVWTSLGDARIGFDSTVAHTGTTSVVIHGNASASDNARIRQQLTVTPNRLYHVELYFKTAGFSGNTIIFSALDFQPNNATFSRMYESPATTGTDQDWTVFDYTFNSRESTSVWLYIGIWGGFSGTVWLDDVMVEETALVNVVRRGGTPLKAYDTSTTFTEGTDFATVGDPALAAHPGTYDPWHAPPVVSVPSGSKLQGGQTVSMDYYTAIPLNGAECGLDLSEPDVMKWQHDHIAKIQQVFPAMTGIFLSYDEMRHMNLCALCQSKHLTSGQLLAQNVQATWQTVESLDPGAKVYVWSDMFDPFHNAAPNYYDENWDVEGDVSGSWAGLEPAMIVMNWNLGSLTKSLSWFSGTSDPRQPHGFQQIISGYYDPADKDGAKAATSELMAAQGIKGVVGLMYTTWNDDYSQLAEFATAAKAGWGAYRASAP
jgi:hypothetical protein